MAGVQTKTAEQHNQERRAAKARQQAARKAAAVAERTKKDNYKVGFKFFRNDAEERYAQLREERAQRERDKMIRESDAIFRPWLDTLRSGKLLVLDLSEFTGKPVASMACSRLIHVCESQPDLYNHRYDKAIDTLYCQRVCKAE